MINHNDFLLALENIVHEFDLRESMFTPRKILKAVNSVSFTINRGEALGLVGESGCGKSTLARCILQLLRPTSGKVFFGQVELTMLSEKECRRFRRHMQMVFQDPGESLSPRMKIGESVAEPLDVHTNLSTAEKQDRLREVMHLVGLRSSHFDRYPHEFSGGQKQRIAIARAIATNPDFIVLDEPTSALDVSVRGQILILLMHLQGELGLSYLFITHDLSVVRHVCQRVAVMYLGRCVEIGPTANIFNSPQHPYTKALLSAVPIPDPSKKKERIKLYGEIPSPINFPPGCALYGRCPVRMQKCSEKSPELRQLDGKHEVACYRVFE